MTLEWEKKSNGQVGQFNFRIPASPLYPTEYKVPTYFGDATVRVRVQTQNRVLFEGVVPQSRVDGALDWARHKPHLQFFPGMQLGSYQYVSIGVGSRVDWSGYLAQTQIDGLIRFLKSETNTLPGFELPLTQEEFDRQFGRRTRFASVRSRGGFSTVFGLPNTLGDVAAGVSVGGGLIGLAILGLAGYAIYKLAT